MKTKRFIFKQNKNYILSSFCLTIIFCITNLLSLASPPKRLIFHPLKQTFLPFIYPVSATEWKLDTTVGNVDLYYKIDACKGTNAVFLKFNNRNNYTVNISWKDLFVTQQVATKSAGVNGEKQLILTPGETVAEDCEDTKNKECILFAEKEIPAYKATITAFEFENIHVNKTP